ncbi:helix-turn-helix domain-containing protein [Paenibacillus sp. MBLB4367]|uniref:helix-turn-helix domain-containing protein n=1 Tax=Paenibacillus sp. MBLB4367 TaxID=3384767 RepID=UPI0039081D33
MQHPKHTLKADRFFPKHQMLYVNRVTETFRLSRHSHEFIELAYVGEGKGFHYIENKVHRAARGQLYVVPIGVSHVFRPSSADDSNEPLIVYNCIFTPQLLENLLPGVTDPPIAAFLQRLKEETHEYDSVVDVDAAIEKLFLALYQEFSFPQSGSSTYLNSLLLQLLVTVYRLKNKEQPARLPAEPAQPDRFLQVLLYMEQHYAAELSLSHLTEKFQWSERHLQRLFNRHTSQTFHRYLQSLRIRKSCEQLRDSPHKISRIAESVGYKDLQSFITIFKRIVGMTPGSYRNRFE